MKKLLIGTLLLTSALPAINHADAASMRPTDMVRGLKTYEAVILDKVKGVDADSWKTVNYRKGAPIKVVERKYVKGYEYLVLSGNVYVPINNKTIKLKKALPGKIDYGQYKMSSELKKELKKLGTKHKDYKAYKAAAIKYEKNYQKSKDGLFIDKLASEIHKYNIMPSGLTGPSFLSYKMYKQIGNEPDAPKVDCSTKNDVNIKSKSFIHDYFMTNNRTVNGVKPGMDLAKVKLKVCKSFGTAYGHVFAEGETGYIMTSVYGKQSKVTDVIIMPREKVTYKEAMALYGKPSSVTYDTTNFHEYRATYNHKKNGWKVIVAFDKYKGNVKYLVKKND